MSHFRKHVFVCGNTRPDDAPRGSCGAKGANPLRDWLKAACKDAGLKDVRINQAGCLDRCELGCTLVVYPEGTWYHYRDEHDLAEILQRDFIENQMVERLQLQDGQKRLSPEFSQD